MAKYLTKVDFTRRPVTVESVLLEYMKDHVGTC